MRIHYSLLHAGHPRLPRPCLLAASVKRALQMLQQGKQLGIGRMHALRAHLGLVRLSSCYGRLYLSLRALLRHQHARAARTRRVSQKSPRTRQKKPVSAAKETYTAYLLQPPPNERVSSGSRVRGGRRGRGGGGGGGGGVGGVSANDG